MNCSSHLGEAMLVSCEAFSSETTPGVVFYVRRMTLKHRIELLSEMHGLYRREEFSRAGTSPADRLESQLCSLLIEETFLRWGIAKVEGLIVDGVAVAPDEIGARAPEALAQEMLKRIRECSGLAPDEEKN